MNGDSLPKELLELEARLVGLPADEPATGLRDRVMQAVNSELERPSARSWDSWSWMTLAASILIVLNVSLISASSNEFSSGPSAGSDPIGSELHALRVIENQTTGKFK